MLKKSLGALLIELREKRNSNQHGVAEAVGCTRKHLGDIERDQAAPDPDLLPRLYLELVPEPARNDLLLATLLLLWIERKFEQDEEAVLSLARKSFDKHPFGGILEAIANDKPAPRDFEDAHSNWINREGYEPEKVVRNLEAALKQRSKDSSLNHLSPKEIEDCLDFARTLTGQTPNRK